MDIVYLGILTFYILQVISADEEPVDSNKVGNLSRYHDQVLFINNFLLKNGFNYKESSNMTIKQNNSVADLKLIVTNISNKLDNNDTNPTTNNSTTNDLQFMPVPAVLSSVIDTLPVHPRIPRRSQPERRRNRRRKHRHSTRVYIGEPVRYLLPPFKDSVQSFPSTFPPYSVTATSPFTIQSTTETITETLPVEVKVDQAEAFQNSAALKYRKVFIPPPLRYLLPPFFYENYINAQPSSTQASLIQESSPTPFSSTAKPIQDYNISPLPFSSTAKPIQDYNISPIPFSSTAKPIQDYNISPTVHFPFSSTAQDYSISPYPSTVQDYNIINFSTSNLLYESNVSSTSLAPIIVVESDSKYTFGDGYWNQNYDPQVEYTTIVPIDYSDYKKQSQLVNSFSTTYSTPSTTKTPLADISFGYTPQYEVFKKKPSETYYKKTEENREFSSQGKYFKDTYVIDKKSTAKENQLQPESFGRYALRSTTPPTSTSTPTTSFPILRGPNLEQTLFETGDFHRFDTSMNESDKTLYMMNKPLLSQEVADAGMKITARMKDEIVKNKKFNRGKLKYRHLKQFNFENQDISGSKRSTESKSSQLLVAETSYYNERRQNNEEYLNQERDIQAIPGVPGQDYPTLSKPPSGSKFSCQSVKYHRGYVADASTGCQVFYICVGNGPGEPMLCPKGTIFSQDFLVCDWWYNVDCQPQA